MPVVADQFAVECSCGTVARGVRTAQSQTLNCANCRGPVFVFPASPLPPDLLGSAASI